ITTLISHLLYLAHQHHPEVLADIHGWVAHPLTVKPLQTNSFDCGIWILAIVTATLRGYDPTGL
ncbi:hypothetical protein BS17DRAFT_690158, partial [Gyrodon lividus]